MENNEIYTALAKFNSEVDKISKDANNPMFKNNYATIDQIIATIRPILSKNGLSILQPVFNNAESNEVGVKTILLHESGQRLETEIFYLQPGEQIINKETKEKAVTCQSVGSAITYCRRYSLTSFLCLNTGEDDDANHASHQKADYQPTLNNSHYDEKKPTVSQLNRFKAMLKAANKTVEGIKVWYKQNYNVDIDCNNMNLDQYNIVCKKLQDEIDSKAGV